MANLILASSSLRRQQLLQQLGLQFDVVCPDIDESQQEHESVSRYVERLAQEKAKVILTKFPDAVILAADTSLGLDGKIIGKPESKTHAFEIWKALSGRQHDVFSGICVATATDFFSEVVQTRVEFQHLTQTDMENYWATGEPVGKAGAYAIQGIAAQFIPRIEGSYSNVVGLPLYETVQLLKRVKVIGEE
ncbi:Maf-like protein [Acinetobacter guerrae]|uniref:Maf-like protein n=1 Tax=Acinetobacter guerrae TaxID=1843371 RepID=UPI00125F083B|nr:Maf-like protein [Acinetobacter guerrae]